MIIRLSCVLIFLAALASGVAPALAQATRPDPGKPGSAKSTSAKSDKAFPDGVSAVTETYEDWVVSCTLSEGQRACILSQVQTNPQNQQRMLTFEVARADAQGISGTMALPFGLSLSQGVRVQIDENAPSPALPFQVCLPLGCLVPFTLDGTWLAKMRTGKQVRISGQAGDGGEATNMSLSLKGFAPGLARLQALQ